MTWDTAHGCESRGSIGRAEHMGAPLTVEQIKELEPGARVVVTWSGGNGPHEGVVVHDEYQGVSYESERGVRHGLLRWAEQSVPLHRVTVASGPSCPDAHTGPN